MRFRKNSIRIIKIISIAVSLALVIGAFFPTWTRPISGLKNSISILKQVNINGWNHEIMIRGNSKNNPVIIFFHGGPGCPEIPYVNKYQDILEKYFTVVQYDQRGSGKSYHFLKDYSKLSIDLLEEDLIHLTEYVSGLLILVKLF